MVWLYLPESVGLNSEYDSPSHLQELFVMSRGKLMRPQYWRNKWKKGGFIRLLSGLMLSHSTANRGVEKWISSVPDSLANPGVMLANSKRQTILDGYGTILRESFARFDRVSYSWKTSQASLMGELIPFSSRWPRSGSMLSGVVYERPKLELTITETGFLSLDIFPTPNASLMATEGSTRLTRALYLNGKATLEEATAINQGYNPLKKKGAMKEMIPTPDANPEKYRLRGNSQASNSLNALHGGKLNPQWVEWLMGWPIGWTDLEHVVMGSCLSKPESPIQSSLSVPGGA